jgi:hypothetical protein
MHDAGCPGTKVCFALAIFGTRPADPEPATEWGLPGRLEAEAADARGMSAALSRRTGVADVLRGADARAVAAARLATLGAKTAAGAALARALALLADVPTRDVIGPHLPQSTTGRHGTDGPGEQQPESGAAGLPAIEGASEMVKAINVHMTLQRDDARTDEDVPPIVALARWRG